MRRLSVLFLVASTFALMRPVAAQEFNCSVAVNYQALTGSEFTFLDELGERVREYINLRLWTQEEFLPFERIDCTMQIVMTEAVSLSRFRARLVVSLRRPIYGSPLSTTVLQLSDDQWTFDYSQGSPLLYEPDRYHALTSVLNFYAYLMLGYDYDTYQAFGGTPYFDQAKRIADLAQNSGASGWTTIGGDQTRGALITQIQDPRYRPLRQAYFDFHYTCLDHFLKNAADARSDLLGVVRNLSSLREDVTRSFYLDQFFNVKYKEMVDMFRGSNQAAQAFSLLSQMDPSHLSDYSTMMN